MSLPAVMNPAFHITLKTESVFRQIQNSILKFFYSGVDKKPLSVCTTGREVTKSMCALLEEAEMILSSRCFSSLFCYILQLGIP